MTCSKGPQVELNPWRCGKNKASVYGAPALPTEPPGAQKFLHFERDVKIHPSLVCDPLEMSCLSRFTECVICVYSKGSLVVSSMFFQ